MVKNDYYNITCISYFICSFFGIIMLYIFPLCEIIIGSMYYDLYLCESFLNISLWLIIKGIISIILLTCIIFYYYHFQKIFNNISLSFLIFLLSFLYLSWNIAGSILFWKYCIDIEPEELNIFLWFSLFFGYLYLLILILTHS